MKAVLVTRYGKSDVLSIKEVKTPSPKNNEVLIKIYSAALNSTDPVFRKGKPYISRIFTGLLKPKYSIPGDVLAGEVISRGNDVSKFEIGDRVYGYTTETLGAHAEYKCLPESAPIIKIPANIKYDEAAGIVDGGHTALVFLKEMGRIASQQKILIYGASGSVGTAAIQIAISCGAEVTGVCSTKNIEMIKSLGVKKVIDYTKNDFTQEDKKYDIIFDTVAKKSLSQCKSSLTKNGIYLTTYPKIEVLLKGLFQSKSKGKRAFFIAAGMKPATEKIKNLRSISELMKNGKIKVVIGKRFPMEEIAEAHEYVETGHKKGNAIINICQ